MIVRWPPVFVSSHHDSRRPATAADIGTVYGSWGFKGVTPSWSTG
jgi:hypothetical protein